MNFKCNGQKNGFYLLRLITLLKDDFSFVLLAQAE